MKKVQDQFAPLIEEIREMSHRLNEAVDTATDQIEELEKRLGDAEPGVSVWGPVLITEDSVHEANGEGGSSEPAERTVTLGFGRAKKKWGFAVREVLRNRPRPGYADEGVTLHEEVSLLRKADRDLRLLALPHLREVVEAVRDELKRRTAELLPETAEVNGAASSDGGWEVVEDTGHQVTIENRA